MKFRAKPVVIEAVQFTDENNAPPMIRKLFNDGQYLSYTVKTAGGLAEVFVGDYIVTEPDGRGHYPVRPDIFESKYEKIED